MRVFTYGSDIFVNAYKLRLSTLFNESRGIAGNLLK